MSGQTHSRDDVYVLVRTRSECACILHWVLFGAVVVLSVTGFYIANPNYYFGAGEAYQAFAMANMRYYHFVAAIVAMICMGVRLYLAFTSSCNNDILQVLPTPTNVSHAIKLTWFYLTGRGEHAVYRFVNPLGGLGIFSISVALFVLTLSGLMMYAPAEIGGSSFWNMWLGFTNTMGGLQTVRLIHHITVYILMFFVIIHVYMQVWKNSVYTEADICSIVAGYKIFPYAQLGHFADEYSLLRDEKAPAKAEMEAASTPMKDAHDICAVCGAKSATDCFKADCRLTTSPHRMM